MKSSDRKRLNLIRLATDRSMGMYSGERADLIPPRVLKSFDRAGFIEWNYPHNPVHKERVTITASGRAALAACGEKP